MSDIRRNDEVLELFPCRTVLCWNTILQESLPALTEEALRVHHELHTQRVPYARPDQTPLHEASEDFAFMPEFIRERVRMNYLCELGRIHTHEVVMWPGTHLPTHVERSDISGILWLDYPNECDPANMDYSGLVVLQNPGGPFGTTAHPWEESRNKFFQPIPGSMLLYPSYVPHQVFPYKGPRPGVCVHIEAEVARG